MNEDFKLAEGRYFLKRMQTVDRDAEAFGFELSAFLTAARSALQYAFEEAKQKNALAWYDACVSASGIIGFFKDVRDVSVHRRPVVPARGIEIRMEIPIPKKSLSLMVHDADGNLVSHQTKDSPSQPLPAEPVVVDSYAFDGWSGPEDVATLCQQYLVAIEAVIADGRNKGVLARP